MLYPTKTNTSAAQGRIERPARRPMRPGRVIAARTAAAATASRDRLAGALRPGMGGGWGGGPMAVGAR